MNSCNCRNPFSLYDLLCVWTSVWAAVASDLFLPPYSLLHTRAVICQWTLGRAFNTRQPYALSICLSSWLVKKIQSSPKSVCEMRRLIGDTTVPHHCQPSSNRTIIALLLFLLSPPASCLLFPRDSPSRQSKSLNGVRFNDHLILKASQGQGK